MPDVLRLHELRGFEGKGAWVSANQYGTELPDEDDIKFVLQHHRNGTWGLAVRGYDDGGRHQAVIERNGELRVKIKDQTFPAVEWNAGVIAVDDETTDRYLEAARQPESRSNLLVQVLERRSIGEWGVQAPAEYNNYEVYAHVHVGEVGLALAWGADPKPGERPESDSQFWRFDNPVPARLLNKGPHYYIEPTVSGIRALFSSALKERTGHYPDIVTLFNEIPTVPTITQYAGITAVTSPHEPTPLEELYGC